LHWACANEVIKRSGVDTEKRDEYHLYFDLNRSGGTKVTRRVTDSLFLSRWTVLLPCLS